MTDGNDSLFMGPGQVESDFGTSGIETHSLSVPLFFLLVASGL